MSERPFHLHDIEARSNIGNDQGHGGCGYRDLILNDPTTAHTGHNPFIGGSHAQYMELLLFRTCSTYIEDLLCKELGLSCFLTAQLVLTLLIHSI